MFKKKHSEINIKLPLRHYSPLRNKTPPVTHPSPRNLSPMKNLNRQINSRTPRKFGQMDADISSFTPRHFENCGESNLESFSGLAELRYDSGHRFPAQKCGFRADLTNDMSYFSNFSDISKDNDRTLKQTKRLFTKCIAEMNSEKRKVCGQRSNNTSNQTSVVQNSKQVISDSKPKYGETAPITSFKALKIQMIESVLPPEKRFITTEKRNSEFQGCLGKGQYKIREFVAQQPKKEQIIQLINHSFSNTGVSRVVEETQKEKNGNILQAKAKILESVYVQQDSDYGDFDLIMRKIQILPQTRKMADPEHIVKISMQSESGSLSMDPFL